MCFFLNCELCWLHFLAASHPNGIYAIYFDFFLSNFFFVFLFSQFKLHFTCCTTDSHFSISLSVFMHSFRCAQIHHENEVLSVQLSQCAQIIPFYFPFICNRYVFCFINNLKSHAITNEKDIGRNVVYTG